MTAVDVSAAGIDLPKWSGRCKIFVTKVLRALGEADREISVVLCDNEFIKNLNKKYRGRNEPTDVLSFAQEDWPVPDGGPTTARTVGDVVISLDMAGENAHNFGVEMEEEIKRLLIHGVLHLLGWDHSDNSPEQEMLALQERILADLMGERLL